MTQEFDPKKSYLSIKANEKMIAYVSFDVRIDEDGSSKEGIIKISSFHRPYGGGKLTLTFIVDTKDNQAIKDQLNNLFNNLTEDSLRPFLGDDLNKIVKVSLDSLEKVQQWTIEEVSVHFRSFKERIDILVEERLLPALSQSLPFSFDAVEWWPPDKPVEALEETSLREHASLKAIFRKWFKGQ